MSAAAMWQRLRSRPLELYVLYRSLALTWAFVPVQVFYLQAQGLSLSDIFDLNVVFSLATVAFEIPTGVFADRSGRRVAMASGGFVMAVGCVLFLLGAGSFWIYALANALFALSMTLSSGADSAWLYDHLEADGQAASYARYEGLATAAKGVGNLIAVLVGGAIYSVAPGGVFVFTALATGVAGLIALGLPERARARRRTRPMEDLTRAFAEVRRDGRLACALAYGAVTFVLLRLSLFADPPHLEVHLRDLSTADLGLAAGLLAAAKELGGALLASVSGTLFQRARFGLVVALLAAFMVLAYAVMGLGVGVACVGAMILLSSSYGIFSPLMRLLMNRLIRSSRDRATLLSVESMGRRVLNAAVSPLFIRAAESSSLHTAFSGTAYVATGAYIALAIAAVVLTTRAPVSALATSP